MTKFKALDKQNVKQLRGMLEAAFEKIYEETGVKVSVGNIGYTETTMNSRLSAVLIREGSPEEGLSAQEIAFRRDFNSYHQLYGLQKEELGKAKLVNGELVVLVGLLPSNRKYPLIGKKNNGGLIKMTPGAWK